MIFPEYERKGLRGITVMRLIVVVFVLIDFGLGYFAAVIVAP